MERIKQQKAGFTARSQAKEKDLNAIFKGAVAEQFVGQELIAYQSPYTKAEIFYWGRRAKSITAERIKDNHPKYVFTMVELVDDILEPSLNFFHIITLKIVLLYYFFMVITLKV